jgi:hypothetical protein
VQLKIFIFLFRDDKSLQYQIAEITAYSRQEAIRYFVETHPLTEYEIIT